VSPRQTLMLAGVVGLLGVAQDLRASPVVEGLSIGMTPTEGLAKANALASRFKGKCELKAQRGIVCQSQDPAQKGFLIEMKFNNGKCTQIEIDYPENSAVAVEPFNAALGEPRKTKPNRIEWCLDDAWYKVKLYPDRSAKKYHARFEEAGYCQTKYR